MSIDTIAARHAGWHFCDGVNGSGWYGDSVRGDCDAAQAAAEAERLRAALESIRDMEPGPTTIPNVRTVGVMREAARAALEDPKP